MKVGERTLHGTTSILHFGKPPPAFVRGQPVNALPERPTPRAICTGWCEARMQGSSLVLGLQPRIHRSQQQFTACTRVHAAPTAPQPAHG